MSDKSGGPAFPWAGGECPISEGMTLRDWFAGQALAGVILSADLAYQNDKRDDPASMEEYARDACAVADALLRARQ